MGLLVTPEQHFNEMMEMFGDLVPNPKHSPTKFLYYVRLYKYLSSNTEIQDAENRS